MSKLFEMYVKQGWSDEKYEAKLKEQKVKEYIGKRVVGTGTYDGVNLTGMKGTIVDVIESERTPEENSLAVRWDEYKRHFHSLQGRVPNGYGFWVNLNVVKILNEDESET